MNIKDTPKSSHTPSVSQQHSFLSDNFQEQVLAEASPQAIHDTALLNQGVQDQIKQITEKQDQPGSSQISFKMMNLEEKRRMDNKHIDSKRQSQFATPGRLRFLSLMKTDHYIKKFKKNLLMNSYIVSKQKKKLLSERFIKQDQHIEEFENSHQEFPLFQLNSLFTFWWDLTLVLSYFIIMWITPFKISFSELYGDLAIGLLQKLIGCHLSLNMLINMNRTIIIQGQEILHRKLIILRYVRKHAPIDVIQIVLLFIPLQEITSGLREFTGVVQIVITYAKVQSFFFSNFETTYLKGNSQGNLIDLVTLIIQIYFYNHFLACIFHYIASETSHLGTSWIIRQNLENETYWIQYTYAFYWATMTMTTVGYGDVTAQNYIEVIFSSIVMLISTCVFAYSMNSIGIILKSIYDQKIKYKLMLISINSYMKKNEVEFSIQSRVRNYIQFYVDQLNKKSDEDVNLIIEQLPISLKDELLNDIQFKIVNQIKLITQRFSKQTQNQLSKNLELLKFIPGDYIVKQADPNNMDLYFIQEGEAQIIEDRTQMKFLKLQKGDTIGQYQFFTGLPSKVSVRSLGFTEIYKISRPTFLNIIGSHRKDFEIFHNIKDQIIFNNNFQLIDIRCQVCQLYTHQEIDCPLLQYKPDLEQRIKKQMFHNSENIRQVTKRRNRTRFYLKDILDSVQCFQQDNIDEDQSIQKKQSQVSITNVDEDQQRITLRFRSSSNVKYGDTTKSEDLSILHSAFVIDRIQEFKYYFPHNNIKSHMRSLHQSILQKMQVFSKYTFNYFVKIHSYRYRKKLEQC